MTMTQRQSLAQTRLLQAMDEATESGLFDLLAILPNGPTIINEFCDLVPINPVETADSAACGTSHDAGVLRDVLGDICE